MPLTVMWDGETYEPSKLTGREIEAALRMCNHIWPDWHVLRYPACVAAAIAQFAARRGADATAVYREVLDLTEDEIVALVGTTESDLPTLYEEGLPKAPETPTTDGSSGVSTDTAGLPA